MHKSETIDLYQNNINAFSNIDDFVAKSDNIEDIFSIKSLSIKSLKFRSKNETSDIEEITKWNNEYFREDHG